MVFGTIDRIYLPVERGKNRGFAMITYKHAEDVKAAIKRGEMIIGYSSVEI